jgi:hypothetical protein
MRNRGGYFDLREVVGCSLREPGNTDKTDASLKDYALLPTAVLH